MFSFFVHGFRPTDKLDKQPAPLFMSTVKSLTSYANDKIKTNALSRAYQHDEEHYPNTLNTPDKKGRTPLIKAILKGDLFTVNWLFNHKKALQNMNHKDSSEKSALMYAAELANTAAIPETNERTRHEEWLVNMEKDVKPARRKIFELLIENSNEPVLIDTLQSFTSETTDEQKKSSLDSAYKHDKKYFPEPFSVTDNKGQTSLIRAILKSDLFTVKWLLKKKKGLLTIDHKDSSQKNAFMHAAIQASATTTPIIEDMKPVQTWQVKMENDLKLARDEIFKTLIESSKEPILIATIQSFTPDTTTQQKQSFLYSAYMHDKQWHPNPDLATIGGVSPLLAAAMNGDAFTINYLNEIERLHNDAASLKKLPAQAQSVNESKATQQTKTYQVRFYRNEPNWAPFVTRKPDDFSAKKTSLRVC